MGKFGNRVKQQLNKQKNEQPPIKSILDIMEDGREFESIIKYKNFDLNLVNEIRRAIKEIEDIRGRPAICYLGNVVNQNIKADISINYSDDLPFSEMTRTVDSSINEVDVIIVTPGGRGDQVAKFVDKLRPRFNHVGFILPDIAMSSGTIFSMSGDEIIMTKDSYIGPIDPQVKNKDGNLVPAQSILTLIKDIQDRGQKKINAGQQPDWTDLQIMNKIDSKDIGNAINGSKYSIELVEKYLYEYKFKHWTKHSSTGNQVTNDEKAKRAKKIATKLCDHENWKTHGRGITRDEAWNDCELKIDHAETIAGLERAIRRFWALMYWVFENTSMYKVFLSQNYGLIRNDNSSNK